METRRGADGDGAMPLPLPEPPSAAAAATTATSGDAWSMETAATTTRRARRTVRRPAAPAMGQQLPRDVSAWKGEGGARLFSALCRAGSRAAAASPPRAR